MEKLSISRVFLIALIIFVIYFCYLIFKPFLADILAATILASLFYRPYEWLVRQFRGRRHIASLVMCIAIALLVIIPVANFIVYAAQEAVTAYTEISKTADANSFTNFGKSILGSRILAKVNVLGIDQAALKGVVMDVANKLKDWVVSGGTNLIKGTTNFLISLLLIIFTTFFFFVDGKKMVEKLMFWTPLPNKYDHEIVKKFRDVSYSVVVSIFVTAIAQGTLGAIAFGIIGLPVFLPGLGMAFLSLLPYFGSAIIWFPVSVYLLATGSIWEGVFLMAWGMAIVSTADNLIRAYLIKGKAQVHPIFVIFSILGGIVMFGFWGVVFGPLIISLAITILHIYELEYENILEK